MLHQESEYNENYTSTHFIIDKFNATMPKTYEITDYDIASLTKNIQTKWPNNQIISYTFKLPRDEQSLMALNNDPWHDNRFPVEELNQEDKNIIRRSFSVWQEACNLKFIENNLNFHYRIYGFYSKNHILGYANRGQISYGKGGIGFSLNRNYSLSLASLHEIGHVLGLSHPFTEPFSQQTLFRTSQDFSVMNYNKYKTNHSDYHHVFSPMPLDYKASQFLYGEPKPTDRFFHVNQYLLKFKKFTAHRSVTSLPLVRGVHTLSAENTNFDFTFDLRENGKSFCHEGDIYTPMALTNVITGSGINKIYLNHLNNFVNAAQSQQTFLYVDPKNCGSNYVIGFNPNRDKIILCHDSPMNLYFDQHFLINDYQSKGTLKSIEFASNQKITFLDTEKDFSFSAIINNCANYLPKKLLIDFFNSFVKNSAVAFLRALTEDLLDSYGCSYLQKKIAILLLEALNVFISGNYIANFVGSTVGEILLSNFKPSANISHFCSRLTAASLNLMHEFNLDSASNLIGSVAGSVFGFWGKKTCLKPFKQALLTPAKVVDQLLTSFH